MKISADEFIEVWLSFFVKHNLAEHYTYPPVKEWTEKVIGKPESFNHGSPFGDFLKHSFSNIPFDYRTEDREIDISFSSFSNFKNVLSLNEPAEKRGDVIVYNQIRCPVVHDLLVEHENKIEKCYEEMLKLTYFKSPLKVLITYNYNQTAEKSWQYVTDVLQQNFSQVLQQANNVFAENQNTQYLLAVGQKIETASAFRWHFTQFCMSGAVIKQKVEERFLDSNFQME